MSEPRSRVTAACDEMTRAGGPLPVAALAALLGCSPRQLQRDFADVLGISPRQFGQAVRTDRTRTALRSADTVLDAAFTAGYGSVRGFYEEAARRLGMTPSDYLAGAPEQVLLWSVVRTPLGDVIAVASPRGLAAVRIGTEAELVREVQAEFPQAVLERDDQAMADVMAALSALAQGRHAPELPVDVHGTAFQARVWNALREIPAGETRTYTEVAESIGSPTSVRAVARACATNRVALAIPCHRVVRSDGSLAGYRWGLSVKQALLVSEGA
jgi:AraC family transcriptional regulator, regulatory protein of adaptative response / methylated-DNA-[protein]-cysteine methyltransferase